MWVWVLLLEGVLAMGVLGEGASGSDEGECGRWSFKLGIGGVPKQGSPCAAHFPTEVI